MTYLEILKNSYTNFKEIVFSPLCLEQLVVGWEAIAYTKEHFAIGGGTAVDKNTALRICVAECLERSIFRKIVSDPILSKKCMLQEFPTTCGFACGFEKQPTKDRSLAEAIERWAWSNWIDHHHSIAQISLSEKQSELFLRMIAEFETTQYYLKNFYINNREFQFGVVLGISNNGIFAGSRVCTMSESPWEHAAIESFRNYKNFQNKTNIQDNSDADFLKKRIHFFGNNLNSALTQIKNATKNEWPALELQLDIELPTNFDHLYLHRTLLKNWTPWNEGPDDRFVY